MSVTISTCKQCDEDYESGYQRGYCSERCYVARKGEKLLNTVRSDHCFCFNCGTKLKEIEKPKPEWAFDETGAGWTRDDDGNVTYTSYGQIETEKAAVGFQYGTRFATSGEKNVHTTTREDAVTTGVICNQCGNTQHNQTFPELRESHLFEYTSAILDALKEKKDQGVHDKDIDDRTVFTVLVETQDLAYAVGKSLE